MPSAYTLESQGSSVSAYRDHENFNSWVPRDTFSWWQDGTSNQIVLGEKHIPQELLGRCERNDLSGTAGAFANFQLYTDCSYMAGGLDWTKNVGRFVYLDIYAQDRDFVFTDSNLVRPLARQGEISYADVGATGRWPFFGSAHPGVVNFLIGDGAVRSFSVSTPAAMMAMLGTVSDGNAVALP